MLPTLMIAAALGMPSAPPAPAAGFAQPLPDAELALSTSRASTLIPATMDDRMVAGVNVDLSREQIDVWWADDGLMLLAGALRLGTAPTGSLALGDRSTAFRFNASTSSLTSGRP